MRRYVLVLITALSLIPAVVEAQGLPPFPAYPISDTWEFSVFGGSSHRGDHVYPTPSGTSSRDVGLNFAPGYLVGGRITQNLGQYFGAEFDYSLANQPLQFTGLSDSVTLKVLNLDHRVHNFNYTVLFYGTPRGTRFRPFGAVGPGVSLFEVFGPSEDQAVAQGIPLTDRWKFGFSWGGGAKYRVTPGVGFRFDFRQYVTGVPDFGLPNSGTAQQVAFRPDGHLYNTQLSVGFFYSFGGRR